MSVGARHPNPNTGLSTASTGPFHITATGTASSGIRSGSKGGIPSSNPAPYQASRTSNAGSNVGVTNSRMSHPTFAHGDVNEGYGIGADANNDNKYVVYGERDEADFDIKKAGDVADEVDARVWERPSKEGSRAGPGVRVGPHAGGGGGVGGVPTFNAQDLAYDADKHKEVWDH